MHPSIIEVLVDLRYRGDYTPKTRSDRHEITAKGGGKLLLSLQESAGQNNLSGIVELLAQTSYWKNTIKVNIGRINARLKYARDAEAAINPQTGAGQLIAGNSSSPVHATVPVVEKMEHNIVPTTDANSYK